MKKIRYVFLSMIILILGESFSTVLAKQFSDIEDVAWAEPYIEEYAEKGIINGYDDGTFGPNRLVTREEFAKVMVNVFSFDIDKRAADFSDVVEGAWYEDYINTLANLQIINGIGNHEFGVGKNITREDMCTLIVRALKQKEYELKLDETKTMAFSDQSVIASYAFEAVKMLYQSGVVNGMDNHQFNPKASVTRAQMVKMIYLANDEAIRKEEQQPSGESTTPIEPSQEDKTTPVLNRNKQYGLIEQYAYSKGRVTLTINGKDYLVKEEQDVREDFVGRFVCFVEKTSGIVLKEAITVDSLLESAREVEAVKGELFKIGSESGEQTIDRDILNKDFRGTILTLEVDENEEYKLRSVEEIANIKDIKVKEEDKIIISPSFETPYKKIDRFILIHIL